MGVKCFSLLSFSIDVLGERKTSCRGDEQTWHYHLSKGSGDIDIPTWYLWVWNGRNEWLKMSLGWMMGCKWFLPTNT